MNKQDIINKINEIELKLIETEINMMTSSYYKELLEIHYNLLDLLAFKVKQEKKFYKDLKCK